MAEHVAGDGTQLPFPNLFVKPVPHGCDEIMLQNHFSKYGEIDSVRVSHGVPGPRPVVPHGFVRFARKESAAAALRDPHVHIINGEVVTVKLADSDMTPKMQTGLVECEWCYIRGLPPGFPREDILVTFSRFGKIVDMKYFASTQEYRGTGALLRYTCTEEARMAILSMNGAMLPGCTQPLLVRFADSPAEKAAKANRKEKPGRKVGVPAITSPFDLRLGHAMQQQQQLEMLRGLPGMGRSASGTMIGQDQHMMADRAHSLPAGPALGMMKDVFQGVNGFGMPIQATAAMPRVASGRTLETGHLDVSPVKSQCGSIIVVRGLPMDADKLWLYENFARFGGILAVRLLKDDTVELGHGMAAVTYVDESSALLARDAMHGVLCSNNTVLQVTIIDSYNLMLGSEGPQGHSLSPSVLSDDAAGLEQSLSGLSMNDQLGALDTR